MQFNSNYALNMWKTVMIILSLVSLIPVIKSDIYSSHVHLLEALERVKSFNDVKTVQEYILNLSSLIEQYREVLRQHRQIKDLINSAKFNQHHPTSVFVFMHRASTMLMGLKEIDNNKLPEFDKDMFLYRANDVGFPMEYDFTSSISGLLRLQDIYRLKANDMASGRISQFQTDPLSLYERLDIAKNAQSLYSGLKAYNDKSFKAHLAIEWLNEAEQLVSNIKEAEHFLEVSQAVYIGIKCECSPKNVDRFSYFKQRFPGLNDTSLTVCKRSLNTRCRALPKAARKAIKFSNFDALCRGDTVQPSMKNDVIPTPERNKRCRYVHNNDPFLLLKPVKVEELNQMHPYIAILHDIIDESEILGLRHVATPYLSRGTVRKLEGYVITETKVSKQYFVPLEKCEKVISNFRTRLAGVSGMHLRSFEKIQVVNYGTGGFYDLHVDLFTSDVVKQFNDAMNNRLVTTVVYLDDVPAGGETTFPAVGVKVQPKRRNAVLFFNMKRNGDLLEDSVHSSCPIVYGEKWVANQWIGRNGQEFNYPCSTDKSL